MQTETMTISELIEWADNQGSRDQLESVLLDHGLIDNDGVYDLLINDLTVVVVTWPDHARIQRPNGDILSVCVA